MNKRRLLVVIIGLLLCVIALVGYSRFKQSAVTDTKPTQPIAQSTTQPANVEGRASFVIYTNGGIRIFADPKYHNQSPDAYITANETNIITFKKEVTWQQFFDTLPAPMKVTAECLYTGTGQTLCNSSTNSLKFYLNGQRTNDLLTRTIQNGDKLLISYGGINADVSSELSQVPAP